MFIEIVGLKIVISPKKNPVPHGLLIVGGVWVGRDFLDQIPYGDLHVEKVANSDEFEINPLADVLGVCVLTQPDDGVIIFKLGNDLFKEEITSAREFISDPMTRIYLNK